MAESIAPTPPPSAPGLAVVTGGTAGIGLAFAERLAARGHDLLLVARDTARLEETAQRLRAAHGVEVDVLALDLSSRSDLAVLEARVADPVEPVALLVNNAGFGLKMPLLDNDVEAEQQMLDVLVTAVMRLTHAALGAMVARGSGRIVNVSSVAGYLPRGTYGAAKAYVTALSEWADLTYGRPTDGAVQVMALCPGFVRTEFHERMDVGRDAVPSFLWLDVDDLVDGALRDLDAGRRLSVPSRRYKALSTLARHTPWGLLGGLQSMGRK
ncbi:SDR family oxidoreductase [Nocardioidaceae bacterium]|nr:SDR family oxidoreductase [Nocardioidaceae bacterium]